MNIHGLKNIVSPLVRHRAILVMTINAALFQENFPFLHEFMHSLKLTFLLTLHFGPYVDSIRTYFWI
jgi:hypothetical protein